MRMNFFPSLTLSRKNPTRSLEEAAEEFAVGKWDGVTVDNDGPLYAQDEIEYAFKAGAEWQASQMPMPEDTVLFNKGVAEGRRLEREDMLKDAEECELYWDGDFLAIDLNMVALGYSEKDKVKVIVLKAEEE